MDQTDQTDQTAGYLIAGGVVTTQQYRDVLCLWRDGEDPETISQETKVPKRQVRALMSIFHRQQVKHEWARDRADRAMTGPCYHVEGPNGLSVQRERGALDPPQILVNHRGPEGCVERWSLQQWAPGCLGGECLVGVEP